MRPGLPTDTALRVHHGRVERMMSDPLLRGDLLLVALGFARLVDFRPSAEWQIQAVGDMLWPALPHHHGPAAKLAAYDKVKTIVLSDRRRYQALPAGPNCTTPLQRRDGVCGQLGSAYGASLVDLATGELSHLVACKRHAPLLRTRAAHNRQAAEDSPPPAPFANTGGVLPQHLPEISWPKLWKALDPEWSVPPERTAVYSLATPKPAPAVDATRKRRHLSLVKGAGE